MSLRDIIADGIGSSVLIFTAVIVTLPFTGRALIWTLGTVLGALSSIGQG